MLLHGPNGAGKTNLLEALHVGTQSFSPRSRRDGTLIRFGADAARVTLEGAVGETTFRSDVVLARDDARRIELNGERLSSGERMRHDLATLVFTPDRLAVVKGGPATRRAYLDRATGRLFPARAPVASDYASAIGQRNAGLRRVRAGVSSREALAPWTDRVIALGETLVESRLETLGVLETLFSEAAGQLGLPGATLVYEGDAPTGEELERRMDTDVERGSTGAGPHLHDVRIAAGGRDLRMFGSQGEQRIAVLSMVIAEAEAIREKTGSSPLVLLDDVLSELDGDRRAALAAMIARGSQTIVTATSPDALPVSPAQALAVSPGEVRQWSG